MRGLTTSRALLLAVALLVAVSPALAGCGQGLPWAGPKPVTLRYAWRGATPETRALLDEFQQAHPHITVELLDAETDSGTVAQGVAAGEVDLLRAGTETLGMAELLLPLDDIHLDEWTGIREDYVGGLWRALSADGQQYGIPAGLDIVVLYVNGDARQAVGASLPPAGQPWDQYAFLDLATALNHPEGLPGDPAQPTFGFCSRYQDLDPFVFLYADGGALVDDLAAPQRPMLDSPATIAALTFYTDLFTRYGVAPGPDFLGRNLGSASYDVALAGGNCGLWTGLFSQRGRVGEYALPFAWEMVPLPGSQPDLGIALVEGYFIPKGSANPAEALLLARFLSDQGQAAGRLLPPRRTLLADARYAGTLGEQMAKQVQALSDDMTYISLSLSPGVMDVAVAVLQAVDAVITQDAQLEPLLLEAQQRLQHTFEP
ncbi:MAG: ABC transporter substrate-binding protein [Anaerolineae bacterium]|jgi:ABC-type glycerol-3-phosphate transport system substrate-binding protein|nr:extracellular solute-binding protein [Chloroflexota bacterium]